MLNLSDVSPMLPVSNDEALTLLTVDDTAEMLMVGKNRVYELLNQSKKKECVSVNQPGAFPNFQFINLQKNNLLCKK